MEDDPGALQQVLVVLVSAGINVYLAKKEEKNVYIWGAAGGVFPLISQFVFWWMYYREPEPDHQAATAGQTQNAQLQSGQSQQIQPLKPKSSRKGIIKERRKQVRKAGKSFFGCKYIKGLPYFKNNSGVEITVCHDGIYFFPSFGNKYEFMIPWHRFVGCEADEDISNADQALLTGTVAASGRSTGSQVGGAIGGAMGAEIMKQKTLIIKYKKNDDENALVLDALFQDGPTEKISNTIMKYAAEH